MTQLLVMIGFSKAIRGKGLSKNNPYLWKRRCKGAVWKLDAPLSCLSQYRLLNAEVSVSMFFCLRILCYVFFWTFWGWGIATLFSLSRVEAPQDWRERSGRGENWKPYFLMISFPRSIQLPPWLAFFVRFACFPRSCTSRLYIPYSKWLSGKGTHMAADKDRLWGIHLKFEVKL